MTYQEIKAYFRGRELPKSLENEYMRITDVGEAVKLDMKEIDELLERLGDEAKGNARARAAKGRLINIIEMLENKQQESKKNNDFSNYRKEWNRD